MLLKRKKTNNNTTNINDKNLLFSKEKRDKKAYHETI